jgi:hypothetical protein
MDLHAIFLRKLLTAIALLFRSFPVSATYLKSR